MLFQILAGIAGLALCMTAKRLDHHLARDYLAATNNCKPSDILDIQIEAHGPFRLSTFLLQMFGGVVAFAAMLMIAAEFKALI